MSSILKALKKLDNQTTDQNHVRFRRPQNHMYKDDHEQITGRLRFTKRYVIILVGLVFAIGSGLILNQKFHERKPKLNAKKETIVQKPARLPEKKVAIPDRVQEELSPRKDVKKIEPIAKSEKAMPLPAHKPRKDSAVSSTKETSPLKKTGKETMAEKQPKKQRQNIIADRFASMPVKQSKQTQIEIQAIAWANDPKSRLAVINGIILRERESIDNAVVIHIDKDAVIFKKGGEEWKQMFGF